MRPIAKHELQRAVALHWSLFIETTAYDVISAWIMPLTDQQHPSPKDWRMVL